MVASTDPGPFGDENSFQQTVEITSVAVGVAAVAALAGDFNRLSIIFSNAGASAIVVAPLTNPTTTFGIVIPPGSLPVMISRKLFGGLVWHPWNAISGVAGQTLTVVTSKRV